MDDPRAVAERYRTVARAIVAETAAVADAAFTKINRGSPTNPASAQGNNAATTPNFTAGEAAKSLSALARVAVTGAVDLIRVPLQSQPENPPMLLADHLATVAARSSADIDKVAQDAAELIDKNAFTPNRWVDTAIKLTSIAMIRGAEALETLGAGPGRYNDTMRHSENIEVAPDEHQDRKVSVTGLARAGVKDEDITALIRLAPAGAVFTVDDQWFLRKAQKTFHLEVNSAGIPSGLYRCTVSVAGLPQKTVSIAL